MMMFCIFCIDVQLSSNVDYNYETRLRNTDIFEVELEFIYGQNLSRRMINISPSEPCDFKTIEGLSIGHYGGSQLSCYVVRVVRFLLWIRSCWGDVIFGHKFT